MVETIANLYTTQAEIERIWSKTGAQLRAEDDVDLAATPSTTNVWKDIIWESTDEINFYCTVFYNPSDLERNLWVRRAASWLGAHFLSLRRGNPAQYSEQYNRIIERLEKINSGLLQIPRLIVRDDLTPAMSNYRIDDRYSVAKIRVQQQISTGGTSAQQDLDDLYPSGWF